MKKYIFKYTLPFCHFEGHNFWLLKPTKLNRGRGIHVCNNIGMMKSLISKYCEGFKKNSSVPPIQPMSNVPKAQNSPTKIASE